ncbi:hypothetical protein B0T25DRAFT_492724 [Lasiosphaeria hispida]|uniref:DUF6546 domain-containing protein n=1 Tax=Lasiosphaeria hispida TaxID=260671 RepID=A0AAJ0HVP7_9PEZI|nr:hypothetical protein B0T25DRAFT_492724 [Lasiosphaeria hispida]
MSWHTLPAELQQMILQFLTPTYLEIFQSEDPYVRAGYARVCREWQWFFEPVTFRRLLLDQDRTSDLDKFTSRVIQRRSYVCQLEEDKKSRKKNNAIFTKAITGLLIILSKWPKREEHPKTPMSARGIYLDLSTFSPSDYQHSFRDFRLQPDYPIWFNWDAYADLDLDFPVERKRAAQLQAEPFHDPSHGWENGHQGPVALGARKRVTEPVTLHGTLPVVNLTTAFAIRRQSTRAIKTNSVKKLLSAFPNLHHFTHEPWQAATAERQQLFTSNYLSLLKNLPPRLPHLQTLTLFQDNSLPLRPTENQHTSSKHLGRALSKTTRRNTSLTELSASFLVDAYDFFHGFDAPQLEQPPSNPQTWDTLKTLYLTSSRLNPTIARWKRRQVLARAGRAAALMPRLEQMVLWNGGEGFGYYVVYNRVGHHGAPMLVLVSSFRSAWRYDLSPDVVAVWREVPRRAGVDSDLQVAVQKFPYFGSGEIRGFEETLDVVWEYVGADVVHEITAHQLMADVRVFRKAVGSDGDMEMAVGEGGS